jgi:hypothetical protein
MEPTQLVALLGALTAGFFAGRRAGSHGLTVPGPAAVVARQGRHVGNAVAATAGQVASAGTGVARRVVSGVETASGLGADAARGAAAGAGFGFVQFRAARHFRARPPRGAPASGGQAVAQAEIATATPGDAPTPSQPGGAPVVLVTAGTRFHRPGCAAVRGDAHEVTRDEALAEGRVPCRTCRP